VLDMEITTPSFIKVTVRDASAMYLMPPKYGDQMQGRVLMSKVFSHLRDLPSVGAHQIWCCANGCGDCMPIQLDYEYSITTDSDDNVIDSQSFKVWASGCCGDGLMLWDNDSQDFQSSADVPVTA
jgi:hypothetical protein